MLPRWKTWRERRADVCPVETAREGKGSRERAWGMSERVGVMWGLVEGDWERGSWVRTLLSCSKATCLLLPLSKPQFPHLVKG